MPPRTDPRRFAVPAAVLLLGLLLVAPPANAADDPSIQGELRAAIRRAMVEMFEAQTLDGVLLHYDPVTDELLELRLSAMHAGIVRQGSFYVSCADFHDAKGRKVDVDVLVRRGSDGSLRATQVLVHKVDGEKRPYHLEEGGE